MRRNNARNGPAIAGSDAFQSRSHFVTPFGLTPDDASVSFAQPRFQASVRLGLGERRKFFQEVDPREPPFGFELLPQVCGRRSAPNFHKGSLPRVLTKCKEIR
ncbi:MAG: hypothetical protein GXY83_37080 [Rhodopirellula sp.]|nr:hypothetical protein [Rhodopirellula sp.]